MGDQLVLGVKSLGLAGTVFPQAGEFLASLLVVHVILIDVFHQRLLRHKFLGAVLP